MIYTVIQTTENLKHCEIKSINFVSKGNYRGLAIIEAAIYANTNQCNVQLSVCGSVYQIEKDDISNMVDIIKER